MSALSDHDAEKLVTLPVSSQALLLAGKVSSTPSSTDSLPKQAEKSLIRGGNDSDSTIFLNGEPVVTNGRDISRFVIDIRDDGGNALTFRSFVLGTILAGLGAALCQVCPFLYGLHVCSLIGGRYICSNPFKWRFRPFFCC